MHRDTLERAKRAVQFKSLRTNSLPSVRIAAGWLARSVFAPRLTRAINRTLYRVGVGAALNRYDASVSLYSAFRDKQLYRAYREGAVFCNFGSGAFSHRYWANYDFPGQSAYYQAVQGRPGVDFEPIDLCQPELRLPISDGHVSLIYCSHTLEHLEEAAAARFLGECFRILEPGGVMRIAIPSTDKDHAIARLLSAQERLDPQVKDAALRSTAEHVLAGSSADGRQVLEDMAESGFDPAKFHRRAVARGVDPRFDPQNPERHITFWDHAKICSAALAAGFECYLPLYRGSSVAEPFTNLAVFDSTEPHISLYGECIK